MISYCLPLLILAADASARTEGLFPQAAEIRRWDFERQDDTNYDQWPDDWTRRRGPGYPLYLKVEVASDPDPRATGGRALRMELDGGAALVYSPLIEVSPLFSYVVRGYIKTQGLRHDAAHVSLLFYDRDRNLLATHDSRHIQQADEWTHWQIGPITPQQEDVRWIALALHLSPRGEDRDLNGWAMFDDLWIGQLPRVSLQTNSPHNVYTQLDAGEVTCHVSGIEVLEPRARFELLDLDGQVLLEHEAAMQPDAPNRSRLQAFSGAAKWNPQLPDYGFYRVRASLTGHNREAISTTLAAVPPVNLPKNGEFGWSLPQGDSQLSLKALDGLLGQAGVHWVKFPLWYGDKQPGRADELAWFAERLGSRSIQLIGVLDAPPEDVRPLFGDQQPLPIASVFVEPELWHPVVDPVMTRLSLKVRWWQLGSDQDTSFVNYPNLQDKLTTLRKEFNRFGQQINLGMAWRTLDETPTSNQPPWSFLSYVSDPPLMAEEIPTYFTHDDSRGFSQWLMLKPLSRSEYDPRTRVRDLVDRMLAAKMQQVRGVFIPDPFDPEHGLMQPDGTPGELFLPWRTTATAVAGLRYLGSIQLPNGSSNQILADGRRAVMVVWNDRPVTETIYLGEDVQQVDVWGKPTRPRQLEEQGFLRQQIVVDRLPTFITGVDPQIARWRMAFRFDPDKIASVFGRDQSLSYHFTNVFEQGVGGVIELHVPEVWDASPTKLPFKLFASEQREQALRISLQPNADSGDRPVRVDFQLTADRLYRFSIYRSIQVGLGDVLLETTSRLDEAGNLVVELQITNTTDRFASFNCLLSARSRRRERRQVFNLGRGSTTVVFVLPQGEQLLGETLWLRAEEIGGARILNHQIIAHE